MTKEDLKKYKDLGWEFYLNESYHDQREWVIRFKSPRMNISFPLTWNKLGGTFDDIWSKEKESDLVKWEAIAYSQEYFSNNRYYIEGLIKDAIAKGEKEVTIKL